MPDNLDSVLMIKLSILEQELTDPHIPINYREAIINRISQLKDPPPPKLPESA